MVPEQMGVCHDVDVKEGIEWEGETVHTSQLRGMPTLSLLEVGTFSFHGNPISL